MAIKIIPKYKRLNNIGMGHLLVLLVFIVGFGLVGTYLLVRSHADTCSPAVKNGSPTIYGNATVTKAQFESWWKAYHGSSPSPRKAGNPMGPGRETIDTLTNAYYKEAGTDGIRPDMALIQMIYETGWWQTSNDALVRNNPAGIDHNDNYASGDAFASSGVGIRAHVQRLDQIVYGNDDSYHTYPRTKLTTGSYTPKWGGRRMNYYYQMADAKSGPDQNGGWSTASDYWTDDLGPLWRSLLNYAHKSGPVASCSPYGVSGS